jgi:type IV secretory pathway VirB3-like protein
MQARETLEIDHLALALTRSPLFMGVNIRLFFANLIFCTLLCIHANTFWGIPLWGVNQLWMMKLSIREPNFLFIWVKVLFKTPPILNYRFWGKTNSYEPW